MTLRELQQLLREAIVADEWFAPLDESILIEARGDFEQTLERAVNELGLSIVVATPSSQTMEEGHKAYLNVDVVIAIAELPLTNTTGKHAAEALDRVIPLLHRKRLAGPLQLNFSGHETEDIPGMAAYRALFKGAIIYR